MPFIVIGKDATDAQAPARRAKARDAHLEMVKSAHAKGDQLMGAAMLNDAGEMVGSVMVVNFDTRAEVDAWLKIEPYVLENVWSDIEVIPCKIPPIFLPS